MNKILNSVNLSKKDDSSKEFIFSIDHCFQIKNKGTIITGTVIKGKIEVGQDIYFPELQMKKTIKEMQMFKKPLKKVNKGDRVGMLIKNLEAKELERTVACGDSYQLNNISGGIFLLNKVKYFKSNVMSGEKIFIIVGNQGSNGKYFFFGDNGIKEDQVTYDYLTKSEFTFKEELKDESCLALIQFDNKLLISKDSLVIGIHLETDISQKVNRIAFYGKLLYDINFDSNITNSKKVISRDQIKIIKHKQKEGKILRMNNDYTAIIIEMFQKDSNIKDFIGCKVLIKLPENIDSEQAEFLKQYEGKLIGEFGQSGKIKVDFNKNVKNLEIKTLDGLILTYKDIKLVINYTKKIKGI